MCWSIRPQQCYSHWEVGVYFPLPWSLGWLQGLTWPIECGEVSWDDPGEVTESGSFHQGLSEHSRSSGLERPHSRCRYQLNATFQPLWKSLSSVAKSCPTLCDPMDCSTPGFPELEIKGDTATCLFVWPQTKTLTTQNAGKDVQPQELSLIAGRNTKWYSSFWKTIWQFLTRLNITVWSSNYSSWYLPKGIEMCAHKNLNMYDYSSFIPNWQNLDATNRWRINCGTMKYSLVLRRDVHNFLFGPMVNNLPCNTRDLGSIPGQGSKIPPAVEQQSASCNYWPWETQL